MKGVRGDLSTIQKIGRVAGVGIAAGFATATAAVVGFTKSALDMFGELDRWGKFSDEIGLSVSAFRGLQLAAEKSGSDVGTLGKSLQRMQRTLGDLKEGVGEGAAGLKILGLNSQDISTDTLTNFKLFAEAIKNLKSPIDQATAAQKSSVGVVPRCSPC